MRVFLDTNVLISAFVSRGLCADLLKIVLRDHNLVVSQLVLVEFERVLRDKMCASEPDLKQAMMVFDHIEVVVDPPTMPMDPTLDNADAAILTAAVGGEVDIFVTGDRELLCSMERTRLPIVTPRRFMELIRTTGDTYPSVPEGNGESRVSENAPEAAREKAFEFAISVVTLCRALEGATAIELSRSLLHAGTRIGLNLEEAASAGSRRAAALKIARASQEARQTSYWLRLLEQSDVAPEIDLRPYLETVNELISLLSNVDETNPGPQP